MANNDWDLDDLLNFDYDKEIPDKNNDFDIFEELESKPEPPKPKAEKGLGDTFDAYDEYRRYEALRHTSDERTPAPAAPEKKEARRRAPVEEPEEQGMFHTPKCDRL